MTTITEADVEQAALGWLAGLSWGVVARAGHRPGHARRGALAVDSEGHANGT